MMFEDKGRYVLTVNEYDYHFARHVGKVLNWNHIADHDDGGSYSTMCDPFEAHGFWWVMFYLSKENKYYAKAFVHETGAKDYRKVQQHTVAIAGRDGVVPVHYNLKHHFKWFRDVVGDVQQDRANIDAWLMGGGV